MLTACLASSVAALLLASTTIAAVAGGCPNETRRSELGSTLLPDCRAYELVSPVVKNGWEVQVRRANESHVTMTSFGSFVGNNQASVFDLYDAGRSANDGWLTAPVDEPPGFVNAGNGEGNLKLENSDLNSGIDVLAPLSSSSAHNLYIRDLPSGSPSEVGPMLSPAAVESNLSAVVADRLLSLPSASADLGSVLFAIEGPTTEFNGANYLWPGDGTVDNTGSGRFPFGFFSLYGYRSVRNSTPELVGVDNERHLISQCGTSLGFPREGVFTYWQARESYNAISGDGSHVFFTAAGATRGPEGNGCTDAGTGRGPSADELYARIDGLETVSISEPALGVPGRPCTGLCREDENQENGHTRSAGVFQGASEGGSKVFFLTSQPLVNADEDETPDLYVAEVGGESGHSEVTRLVQVSHDANPGEAAEVQGVTRVAGDGSRVYFVARGVLTKEANPVGAISLPGADNLYVYDTNTGRTAFIGDLCSDAETSGLVSDSLCPRGLNAKTPEEKGLNDLQNWQAKDERPADVNSCKPDLCEVGRFLVFASYAHLTPDDTSGVAQIFEYDAENATLVRVSVGQAGFSDDGNMSAESPRIIFPSYTDNQNPAPQLTTVSADGAFVVFQSNEALTSQAAEGYGNVYEYHDGEVSLISDGQDRSSGFTGGSSTSLLGMDESGTDIFFTTADQLVPQDGDTQVDVYDARIDGGFGPIAAPPTCDADGCQGALAPAPAAPVVGSTVQPAGEDIVESSSIRPIVKVKQKTSPKKKRRRVKARHAKPRLSKAGRKARAGGARHGSS